MPVAFVAQVGSLQACPVCDPKPHVGGPVLGPGAPTVLVCGKPVALEGDRCTCTGPPSRIQGSGSTVRIAGKEVARVGNMTDHGGIILLGCPSVMAG
jgi:uncharacterized Zn-binding protein involved in type VI secretion